MVPTITVMAPGGRVYVAEVAVVLVGGSDSPTITVTMPLSPLAPKGSDPDNTAPIVPVAVTVSVVSGLGCARSGQSPKTPETKTVENDSRRPMYIDFSPSSDLRVYVVAFGIASTGIVAHHPRYAMPRRIAPSFTAAGAMGIECANVVFPIPAIRIRKAAPPNWAAP